MAKAKPKNELVQSFAVAITNAALMNPQNPLANYVAARRYQETGGGPDALEEFRTRVWDLADYMAQGEP